MNTWVHLSFEFGPGSAVGEHTVAGIGPVSCEDRVVRLCGVCPHRQGWFDWFRRGGGW
jgi:hypothetical protein